MWFYFLSRRYVWNPTPSLINVKSITQEHTHMCMHTNLLSLYNSQRKSPSPCPDFIFLDFLGSIYPSHVQDKMVKQTSLPVNQYIWKASLYSSLFYPYIHWHTLAVLTYEIEENIILVNIWTLPPFSCQTVKHTSTVNFGAILMFTFPFRKLKHYLCPSSVTGCHFVLSQFTCIEPPGCGGSMHAASTAWWKSPEVS